MPSFPHIPQGNKQSMKRVIPQTLPIMGNNTEYYLKKIMPYTWARRKNKVSGIDCEAFFTL